MHAQEGSSDRFHPSVIVVVVTSKTAWSRVVGVYYCELNVVSLRRKSRKSVQFVRHPTKASDIPCSNISSPRDRVVQRYAYLYKRERTEARPYSQRAKRQSGERLRTARSSVTKYYLFKKKQRLFHIQAGSLSSFFLSCQGRTGLCLCHVNVAKWSVQ